MSYTPIYYHIIYSTKDRAPVLTDDIHERFFKYLWRILEDKGSHLYRINAVADHVHILTSVHPGQSLASLIRDLKSNSTTWIKDENLIPAFPGWQEGYAAFTKSVGEREKVIQYIKRQQEHHRSVSSLDELRVLLREEGVKFDERYLK